MRGGADLSLTKYLTLWVPKMWRNNLLLFLLCKYKRESTKSCDIEAKIKKLKPSLVVSHQLIESSFSLMVVWEWIKKKLLKQSNIKPVTVCWDTHRRVSSLKWQKSHFNAFYKIYGVEQTWLSMQLSFISCCCCCCC